MSDTEKTNLEFGTGQGIEDLRSEVRALKTVLCCALLLVFVFSLCVNVFLLHQTSTLNGQLVQATQLVNAWANGGPAQAQAIDFWNKLNEYSRTHADFAPIINKFSPYIHVRPTIPKKS